MITVSVRLAWETAGSRKTVTPLLTASTPVMAVQPLANDRIKIQSRRRHLGRRMRRWRSHGHRPALHQIRLLATPIAKTPSSDTMKR